MDDLNRRVDVTVESPKSDSNVYEWDAKAQVIRLRGIRYRAASLPFERGTVANSLTAYGESLPALLAITLPTFEGCTVNARVVGALEREGETTLQIIVAVAAADTRLAHVDDCATLEPNAQAYIENELRDGARWLDANAAFHIAHAARQRWVLTRGDGGTERAVPAWQADEEEAVRADERGVPRHSLAEARLYTLPLRFQNYVASLLASDERILLWVHRPLITHARLGVFRREVLRQGVLVITNQQCLWMVDPVTPSHTVGGYGYVARTFAVERLRQARLEENKALRVVLELTNAPGAVESFAIEFPPFARSDLEQVVRVLNAFVPRAKETRLIRRLDFQPIARELGDPTTSDAEGTRATLKKLREVLAHEIDGETIYAQAFIPAWGGAKLLTVTNRHLLAHALPHTFDTSSRARVTRIPLAAIGTVEICNSALGSWFRVWLPTREGLEKWEMSFPVVFAREFGECALALRVLLAKMPLK